MTGRAALTLALLAGLAACGEGGGDIRSGAAPAPIPAPGDPAPDYTAESLDGDAIRLGDLAGEVVLLNVWATWCAPCRREIPELEALHEAHSGSGLRVVGVSVDHRAALDQVRRFVDELGVTYEVWLDPSQEAVAAFGAFGVPLTVLIDRDGRIAWSKLGALEREDPGLAAAVDRLLST